MFKFFRNIRQRMITQTRFSKYLIYAIGEIVLVVIGILIALQVNNWNENRKQHYKEILAAEQLLQDAVADSSFFAMRQEYTGELLKNLELILQDESSIEELKELYKPGIWDSDSEVLVITGFAYLSIVDKNSEEYLKDISDADIKKRLRFFELRYHYVEQAFEVLNTLLKKEIGGFEKEHYNEIHRMYEEHSVELLKEIYKEEDLKAIAYIAKSEVVNTQAHLAEFQRANRGLIYTLEDYLRKNKPS